MTAEIAIINRTAVTLAADSAMTVSVRGREKIYTSAEKIFELSNCDHIALMVYNSPAFLEIPFELAAKQFRDKFHNISFNTVEDASEKFFEFLMTEFAPDRDSENKYVQQIISRAFSYIASEFSRKAMYEMVKSTGRSTKTVSKRLQVMFMSEIDDLLSFFHKQEINEVVKLIPDDEISKALDAMFDDTIAQVFKGLPLENSDKLKLRSVALAIVKSDCFSDFSTGLVFAGFGLAENFPALHSYEMDGVLCGRIKRKRTHNKKLTKKDEAHVIPFAQREMVDRFMLGVDPSFESGIINFCETTLNKIGEEIIKDSTKSRKKSAALRHKLKDAVSQTITELSTKIIPDVKAGFREEVEDMVLFMAKPELASLAEALVNITSVKRKFSTEQETVAGPIDVAVISKIDGFVWVKRKHYFEPGLNPRYFWRKYKERRMPTEEKTA